MGIYTRALEKSKIKKDKTDVRYTSAESYDDYYNAYINALQHMTNPKEDTSIEDNGNTVVYKKRVSDDGDKHWYENYSIRTETTTWERREYHDIEYWGTYTDGITHYVHFVEIYDI